MTPSQHFLPKDRDGALHIIKDMLYTQLTMLNAAIEELDGADPGDGLIVGKLIAYTNQRMFLNTLLHIIERS